MREIRPFLVFLLLLNAVSVLAEDQPDEPLARALDTFLRQEPASHSSPRVQPMTLAELEAVAVQQSAEITLAARQAALAQSRIGAAGALEDPQFMFRGWGVPLAAPWDFNRAQNMFMVSQPLPGWGKRAMRSDIAAQEVATAGVMLEAKRREITARVRTAYYDLLLSRDEVRLHHEQVALARQALESARIRYTVGRVPQQDVLKAQIALTKLVGHLVDFEQAGQLARAALNTLMGRLPDAPLDVVGAYQTPAALPSLADLEEIAIARRPELLAVESQIKREELALKLARKAYTPDFTVSAGYMLQPTGSPQRNAYMAEFSLNLPWLNRRKHDSEISQAQSAQALRRAEYDAIRAVVLQQIQEALIRARSAKRLADLYRDTLRPQAQATFKAANAAYQTDRTDFLNLLDSQNTMLEVEYAYYRALAEFERRLAEL
ncbi:MAG: TolC family protein, partial [Terriglobales bacterium]